MIYHGLRRFLRSERVENTSTIPIASAAQGLVEFQGYAYPLSKTKTTLEGKECVYLSYELQKKSKNWHTVWTFNDKDPFAIVDSSGLACVDPTNINLDSPTVTQSYNSIDERGKQRIESLVGSSIKGFPPSFGILGTQFRIVQKAIYFASPILVIGNFHTDATATSLQVGADYPAFFKRVQEVMKNDRKRNQSLQKGLSALTDTRKAHSIKRSLEGEQGENDSLFLRISLDEGNTSASQISITSIGTVAANSTHSLYVADSHEAVLLKRIGQWNLSLVIGGAALIAVGLYLFFEKHL